MKKLERITIGSIDNVAELEKVEYLGKGYLELDMADIVPGSLGNPFPFIQYKFTHSILEKDGRRNVGSFKLKGDFDYFESLEEMNDFLVRCKYYLTNAKYKQGIISRGCYTLMGRIYEEKRNLSR